ncbi:hypothetical protein SALWKB2_2090 [Snodgrassella alvi wkB2]|nr:hypothetical protein SALWKB2_2090 [Snodgrassella alvi wkB2]
MPDKGRNAYQAKLSCYAFINVQTGDGCKNAYSQTNQVDW